MSKLVKFRGPATDPDAILQYSNEHPELNQTELAQALGISQKTVSRAMISAGINKGRRGGIGARPRGMSEEAYKWEKILHNSNLSMSRGNLIDGKKISYGHKYNFWGAESQSATLLTAE